VVTVWLPTASAAGDNRLVSAIERRMPPLNADERTTLESWLDFHRVTLAMKCEGLDNGQAAAASVPPSAVTLTGLVQHMAEVERNWFRRVFAGEQAPPIYDPRADPDGPDGGFEHRPALRARSIWCHAEQQAVSEYRSAPLWDQ
jgi:hypothetical protein